MGLEDMRVGLDIAKGMLFYVGWRLLTIKLHYWFIKQFHYGLFNILIIMSLFFYFCLLPNRSVINLYLNHHIMNKNKKKNSPQIYFYRNAIRMGETNSLKPVGSSVVLYNHGVNAVLSQNDYS